MKSSIISKRMVFKPTDDIEKRVQNFWLKENREFKKGRERNKKILIIILITIFLLFTLYLLTQPGVFQNIKKLTGLTILSNQNTFSDQLNLNFNSSQNYIWTPENYGQLSSVKISGKLFLQENSSVKIFLDDKLILDSSQIEQGQQSEQQNNSTGITGFAINDLSENITNISEENITTLEENVTLPEENITTPGENATEENITTQEIKFSDICIDTCNLKDLNLNETSYNLRIEIENADLQLDKIDYTISPIENISEENVTEENITNNLPILIQEIPNQEILVNSSKNINLLDYFSDSDNNTLSFNFSVLENGNLTTLNIDKNIFTISSNSIAGLQKIIIYASDENLTTESNKFLINVTTNATENLTEMELIATKEVFSPTEEPEFELREKNSKNKVNNEKPIKANNKLSQGDENLELYLYNEDNLLENDIKIEKIGNEFKINLPREKEFRPGKYILTANYTKNGKKYNFEQYFYWGVLAINTHKSIYLPNEMANISIGVLDLAGRVFCLANVTLEITDSKNKKTTLTTENGDIKISKECEIRDFTYIPDYSTSYQVNNPGTYQMKLIATTNDGTYSIKDSFEVQESVPFDVSRESVTRINPAYKYETKILVKANQNYQGTIVEKVPKSFEIKTDGNVIKNNDIKEIQWQVDLKTGNQVTLTYEFDAPDIWPLIFLTGPLEIGSWQESREWQIASDQAANLILLWDDAVLDAPAGWTCISCGSGDFYGRFIRGFSSYGVAQGGSATHSHTSPGTLNSLPASIPLGTTSTTNTKPPVAAHTHTTTVTSGLSADNLPAFRNLKVIKYSNGVPETLPAGVIAVFSAAPSVGWTQVDNDNKYIRGNTTANVNTTGGSNTHTHTIVLAATSLAANGGSKIGSGINVGGLSHNHATSSGISVANSSEPPYITVILAKKDSAGAIPVGMIGMFDATPPAAQWTVVSNGGGTFTNRFFKPTGTYGTTSDVSTHTHTSLTIITPGPNNLTAAAALGTTFSSNLHTHSFSVSFDAQDQTPIYWDVIFANATAVPAPSLEQIHYHWRNDDDIETAATSATGGSEDTVLTNAFAGNKRLRIEISNEGGAAAENYQYRLEYGLNTSTCAAIVSWTDVGAANGDWDMYPSTNLTEGADTTNIAVATGGVSNANPTFKTPNAAVKDTSSTLAAINLTSEDYLEMEFSIKPNVNSGAYCFRITNASSTTNFVYTKYAEAIVDAVAPTATQGTAPIDYYNSSSQTVVFDAKCSDNIAVSALQIWANDTGAWHALSTEANPTNDTWYNVSVGSLTAGKFLWGVRCNDTVGNAAFSAANRTITVDISAPTADFGTNPIDNYNSSSQTVVFDLKCADDIAVSQLMLYSNWSGSWVANQTNTSPTNNTYWNISVVGIPEGIWRWAVYCNDSVNLSDWSDANRTLTVDLTAPTITIVSPTTNYYYNTTSVWFNVTLNEDGSWCGYSLDSAANVTMTNSSGNWNNLNSSMTERTHIVTFYCNDTAGNMASTVPIRTFYVDLTNPVASFGINPEDGSTKNSSTVVFDAKCADNIGLQNLQIWTNKTGNWAATGGQGSPTNNTFYNVSISSWSDGNYVWAIKCIDHATNTDFTDTNRTLTIDTTAPTADFGTNPIDNYNDSDGSITFDLKCSDNAGVSQLYLYSNWSGSWIANQTNSSPSNNTVWNVSVVGIPDGTWRWAAYCNDSVNLSDWSDANRTLTVDKTAPVAAQETNPIDNYNSSSQTVVFDLKCADNIAVSQLMLYSNWSGSWIANQTNSSPSNNTVWNISVVGIPEGIWLWAAYCNDTLNNSDWSDANRTLTVDVTTPVATQGVNPVNNYNSSSQTVVFDAKCADNLQAVSLQIWANDTGAWHALSTEANPTNDTWYNVSIGSLTAGTFLWGARCNDSTGTAAWSTNKTITVDVTNPVADFGTAPVDNYNDTDGSITFDLKCADNIGVSQLQLWTNTTGVWQVNQTNSSPSNNTYWNVTVDGIPEGNFIWAAYCNDTTNLSDWSDTNRSFSYSIPDITNPVADFGTAPVDNYNDTDGSITFDLKCADNIAVSQLMLYSNWSGSWIANQTNSSPSNNTVWNISVVGIPDGTWRWAAWCNDTSNNPDFTDTNRTITVDSTAPTATQGTAPIDYYNSSSQTVIFDAKCSDNVAVSALQIWANDTGAWHALSTEANPTNDTWYNVSIGSLTAGTFLWGVRCNDTFGNAAFSAANRTITVDVSAPTITLPVYTNATQKKNTESLTLNVSVTDAGVGASYCTINVATSSTGNVSVAVSDGWCNTTYNLADSSDGNQTIEVYANDTLGNTALNNSYVVWIDTTAPSVSSTQVNDTSLNTNELICVDATATDAGVGVDKVWAYITFPNATDINITMDDDVSSCSGSLGDDIYGIDIDVGSTAGTLTINTTYANDTVNNLGYEDPWPTLNVTVTVADGTNPVASFGTNPVDNYNDTDGSIQFDLKCSDNVAVDTIQLWGNWSGTWEANYTNPSYENDTWLNITVTGIPQGGNHKWAVWCNDTVGLTNITDNRTFNIQVGSPTSCGLLSTPDTTITLIQNVSSEGTCYNITAENVAIDCNGFTINYSSSAVGYGIYTNSTNTTVKNCVINPQANPGGDIYSIYFKGSSNGTIFNNTITDPYSQNNGIYLSSSSNNNITNNNITTPAYAMGIYLSSSSNNNNITNNNILCTGYSGSEAIKLSGSSNNIITRNNLNNTDSDNDAPSIALYYSSSNNTFTSNNLTTINSNGYGFYSDSSSNSTLIGNIIVTSGNGAYGFYFTGTSTGTLIKDTIINASYAGTPDIYSDGSGINNFTNCTFNKSDTNITSTGSINVFWYADAYVNDSGGNAVESANVTSTDINANLANWSLTNSSGYIQRLTLREYWQNATAQYFDTNYTFNASKATYTTATTQVNLTNNAIDGNLGKVVLTLTPSDSVYPIFSDYGDNNGSITSGGTALFNVTVENTNGTVWLSINGSNYTASNLNSTEPGTITRVNQNGSHHTSNSDPLTVTLSSATAGNLVVITLARYGSADINVSEFSGTNVGTFHSAKFQAGAGGYAAAAIFWTTVTANGDISVTWTPASEAYLTMALAEYSGANTTDPFESTNSSTGSSEFPVTGIVSPTINSMLIGIVSHSGASTISRNDTSFGEVYYQDNFGDLGAYTQDKNISAGDYDIKWDLSGSESWTAVGGSIRAANVTTSTPSNFYNVTVVGLTNGTYVYNWSAYGNGTTHNFNMSIDRDYTVLESDTTNPLATQGTAPIDNYNDTNGTVVFDLKCSDNTAVSTIELWSNWSGTWQANYSNSSYINNTWLNITVTGIPSGNNHKWAVWCNDTSGLTNITDNRTFNIGATSPTIEFVDPTPPDGNVTTNDYVYVNVSVNDFETPNNLTAFIDWNRTLIGWWAMDYHNATGIYDNSSYSNFGAFNGTNFGESNITNGEYGKGLAFDGVDDYIKSGNVTSFITTAQTPGSVSAWIYLKKNNEKQGILCFGEVYDNDNTWALGISANGNLTFFGNGWAGGWDFESNLQPPLNEWSFVSVVVNSSSYTFYLNGQSSVVAQGGDKGTVDSPNPYILGALSAATQFFSFFNGSIDDVRLFNRILSAEEINASYNAGLYRLYNNFTNLNNGLYNYTAYVQDLAGNVNSTSRNVTIQDVTNPIAFFGTNPIDNYNDSDGSITFDLKCSDNTAVSVMQLWTNTSGTWQANQTNSSPTNNSFWNVTLNGITDGSWKWAVWCNDTFGNSDWTDTNRTFNLETGSNVTVCRELNLANTIYLLQNNVSSAGTCFDITVSNITLDCQGYKINYSQTTTGNAVLLSASNNTTVKNCDIVQGSESDDSGGISAPNPASNITVLNNNITTSGNSTQNAGTHGIYFANLTSGLIQGNNITTHGSGGYQSGSRGISLYATTTNISNNIIYSDGVFNSEGIGFVGSFNNIAGNNVTTNSDNGDGMSNYGWAGYEIANNNFSSNRIQTTGTYSCCMYFVNNGDVKNNVFMDNYANASGYGTCGYSINSPGNNTFIRVSAYLYNFSDYGLRFYNNSINNKVFDSTFFSQNSDSVYFEGANSSANLTNCTFGTIGFSGGSDAYANVFWYADAYVNDSEGNTIDQANVTVEDVVPTLINYSLTNSSGYISRLTLREYWQNATAQYFDTNYTFNASKTSYTTATKQVNLTNNAIDGNLGKVVLTLSSTVVDTGPVVTLNNPDDNANLSSTGNFNCTAYDDQNVTNISLYGNWSGSWTANQTNSTPVNNSLTTFDVAGLTTGQYVWNCQACDNASSSNCTFASANRTINVNATAPSIEFVSPTPDDGANTSDTTISINVSISEQNLQSSIFNWNGTNYSVYNDSLVLMMNFDNLSSLGENATHVVDLSRYSNNGTVVNAVLNDNGKYGKSFSFDGNTDHIDVIGGQSVDLKGKPFTLAAWIKLTTLNEWQTVMTKDNDTQLEFWFGVSNNNDVELKFPGDCFSYCLPRITPISDYNWHYIVAVFNGTHAYGYLDGAPSTEIKETPGPDTNGSSFHIGDTDYWGFNGNSMNGDIDEVRIWNRTLSAAEINQQYMMNLQKYNSTQWYLFINQVKDSTYGLDVGAYTYQAYAQNLIGNMNSTETRNVNVIPSSERCVGANYNFSCGDSVNESCTMSGIMSATATCFNVTAENVAIDCNGFTINYSSSEVGYGVYTNSTNTTVKNCIIRNTNKSLGTNGAPNAGIYFSSANNGTAYNNTIYSLATSALLGYTIGINLISSSYSNISDNIINFSGNGNPAINLVSTTQNTINNNTCTLLGLSYENSAFVAYGTFSSGTISNNNFIVISGAAANGGIYSYSGALSNSIIQDNNFSFIGGSYHGAIYTTNGNNNSIYRNIVNYGSSSGTDSIFQISTNNTNVTNNSITSLSSYKGIYLSSAINVTLSGNSITTTGNGAYGIYFTGTTTNSLVKDTIIDAAYAGTADVYSNGSGINNLTNCTFNESDTNVTSTGSINVFWYADAYVNDSEGNAIDQANVTVEDVVPTLINWSLTNSSGYTPRLTLREYWQNATAMYFDTNYTFNASKATFDTATKQVNLTTNKITNDGTQIVLTLTTAAAAPTIDDISAIPDQNVTESGVTNVTFYVNVSDVQGYGTINTVNATFTKTDEETRYNSSCEFIANLNDTQANYSCTVGIWYWDGAGTWTINATANDTTSLISDPYSETFTLNEWTCFVVSPSALTWPGVTPGSTNRTSNNDPSALNNTCNKNTTVQIKAIDLQGESTPTDYIVSENFTADIETGLSCSGSACIECDGTALQNNTFKTIVGATLPAGNNSNNQGMENIYYCIVEVNASISAQTYSTTGLGAWVIKVISAMALIVPAAQLRKKKRNNSNRNKTKEKWLKILGIALSELKENHLITTEEILEEIKAEQILIPVSIFKKENKLGALESLCKYMKENLNLNFSEIARLIKRDERTVWTAYNKAHKKKSIKFVLENLEKENLFIPIEKFGKKETILETLILFLRDKFNNVEVAKILGRDPRNTYFIYKSATNKNKYN